MSDSGVVFALRCGLLELVFQVPLDISYTLPFQINVDIPERLWLLVVGFNSPSVVQNPEIFEDLLSILQNSNLKAFFH